MDKQIILDYISKKKFNVKVKDFDFHKGVYEMQELEVVSVSDLVGFIKMIPYFKKSESGE